MMNLKHIHDIRIREYEDIGMTNWVYRIILYYIILYCAILYYIIIYSIMLY